MTVSFDRHEFRDTDRAVIGDPPDIISSEINKHQMLSSFFRIRKQLFAEELILLNRTASLSGSRDWPNLDGSPSEPDVYFR
jgi:hypothetical protein